MEIKTAERLDHELIRHDWPSSWLDGKHLLVWKGVLVSERNPNNLRGLMGVPYAVGRATVPLSDSYWMLSPLGPIKDNRGSHIIAAVIRLDEAEMLPNQTLITASPALVLACFDKEGLPGQLFAERVLARANYYYPVIDRFDEEMRGRLVIPQDINLPPALPEGRDGFALRLRYFIDTCRCCGVDKILSKKVAHYLDIAEKILELAKNSTDKEALKTARREASNASSQLARTFTWCGTRKEAAIMLLFKILDFASWPPNSHPLLVGDLACRVTTWSISLILKIDQGWRSRAARLLGRQPGHPDIDQFFEWQREHLVGLVTDWSQRSR